MGQTVQNDPKNEGGVLNHCKTLHFIAPPNGAKFPKVWGMPHAAPHLKNETVAENVS